MTTKNVPVLLFALAGAIFVSCTREKPVSSHAPKNQNWTILAKTDISNEKDRFQGIWQPSESEMPRLIQEARLYLENLKQATSSDYQRQKIVEVLAGWDKYACQVIGHTKDGKKLIHLNFFPKEDISESRFTDWQHRYIVVFDGGADFWRIEYDYNAKAFLDFESNGEA